jgi:hypothetical protein
MSKWLQKLYQGCWNWLNPCYFHISVNLTAVIATATVPAMTDSAEPIKVKRTFEVEAASIQEAVQIALENARLAFSSEGYQVRGLEIEGVQEATR